MLKNKNYVYGDDNVEVPAHLNFGKFILQRIRQFKTKTALLNAETNVAMSYEEFTQLTVNLSYSLSQLGIGKGDVVAIGSHICNEFLPTALAIICTGATFTPIDVLSGPAVLRHKFSLTRPNYVICTDAFWLKYEKILTTMNFINAYITYGVLPESAIRFKDLTSKHIDIECFEPAEVKGQTDTAIILYSSGTTGMPKGVMLTHLNSILATLPQTCFSDKSITNFLTHGSWFHNYHLFTSFMCLAAGKLTVFETRKDYHYHLKDIEKYKIEIFLTIPVFITYFAKCTNLEEYNLSSLKLLYSRSFPLHIKTINVLKKRIPTLVNVIQGYGITESGEPTSESRILNSSKYKTGGIGLSCPTIIIKVIDVNTKQPLGPNQAGEIYVKGDVLMKGYIGITPSDHSYLDEEGFFKTGDLGYYDEDNYFFIKGRLKEIIKCNGYQVSPLELETVLLQHLDVQDVGVIGVPDQDVPNNELIAAMVVKKQSSNITEQELIDYVDAEVSNYMKIHILKFINEVPRNVTGKILRKSLLDIYNKGGL